MLLHKIQTLCKEKNVALTNVERLAGLSANSIYRWDESMPSADKLVKVARILGTTAEELLKE